MERFGIDIGGTKCTVTQSGPDGSPGPVQQRPTAGPAETLQWIADWIDARQPGADPVFGISCGSPLDERQGLILSPPNLPGWDRVQICRFLTDRFGGRARLMNDANAGALAERRWGAGAGSDHMIFLTVGTGCGAGILSAGTLICGATGHAGEIGHVRLTDTGPLGYHKRGSVEGWASGGGMAQRVEDLKAEGKLPADWPWRTAREVFSAAGRDDPDAMELVIDFAHHLGRALAILVDLLNPDTIVLGSIYARAVDLIEPTMRRALAAEALPHALEICRIVPAGLGDRLGAHQALAVADYEKPGA
ncbi:MAG: ROK family protein [Phycisphaerae bacterium]